MKNKYLFLLLLILVGGSVAANAQTRTNRIYRPCPSVSTPASVNVALDGSVTILPCAGKTASVNGTAISTLASGGTFTANFFPFATGANTLANSPYLWNGTNYIWNNTALTGVFLMNFTPGLTTAGSMVIGEINRAGLTVNNATNTVQISPGSTTSTLDLTGVNNLTLQRTFTTAGTTGAQTINKPAGSVNFVGGPVGNLIVTNNTVTTTSLIVITAQRLDATCTTFGVDSVASGSFIITKNANCTAETRVAFWVTN